jgi:hypothetical protein
VLDCVAAAAAEVTIAAGLPAGPADMIGRVHQVNFWSGHSCTGWVFFVAAGGVVANQAVNPRWVAKIE